MLTDEIQEYNRQKKSYLKHKTELLQKMYEIKKSDPTFLCSDDDIKKHSLSDDIQKLTELASSVNESLMIQIEFAKFIAKNKI